MYKSFEVWVEDGAKTYTVGYLRDDDLWLTEEGLTWDQVLALINNTIAYL